MDMISAISNLGSMSPYSITSINGNPRSLEAIGKIGDENSQKNKALVIAKEQKNEDELYVKDYGELANTTRLETGAFAEVLSMKAEENSSSDTQNSGSTVAFYNDTIGMMGYSNMMRTQLTGQGFTPFN